MRRTIAILLTVLLLNSCMPNPTIESEPSPAVETPTEEPALTLVQEATAEPTPEATAEPTSEPTQEPNPMETPILTPVENVDVLESRNAFSIYIGGDDLWRSNMFFVFVDGNGEICVWNKNEQRLFATGIRNVKELVHLKYDYCIKNLDAFYLLTNDGEVKYTTIAATEDGTMSLGPLKSVQYEYKITHISLMGYSGIFAIDENGKLNCFSADFSDSFYDTSIFDPDFKFPKLVDIQSFSFFYEDEPIMPRCYLAKSMQGDYYGWCEYNIFGDLIIEGETFQAKKAIKLDIDPNYKTVLAFRRIRNSSELSVLLLLCVDQDNTAIVMNNKKQVLMRVPNCTYACADITNAWIVDDKGKAFSFGNWASTEYDITQCFLTDVNELGSVKLMWTAGWNTIAVYENGSIYLWGQITCNKKWRECICQGE